MHRKIKDVLEGKKRKQDNSKIKKEVNKEKQKRNINRGMTKGQNNKKHQIRISKKKKKTIQLYNKLNN